jgi:hypothetical protein
MRQGRFELPRPVMGHKESGGPPSSKTQARTGQRGRARAGHRFVLKTNTKKRTPRDEQVETNSRSLTLLPTASSAPGVERPDLQFLPPFRLGADCSFHSKAIARSANCATRALRSMRWRAASFRTSGLEWPTSRCPPAPPEPCTGTTLIVERRAARFVAAGSFQFLGGRDGWGRGAEFRLTG